MSAPNSSFDTVLRISDLCKSVHGGSSANVIYLKSSVSLLSGGEASSWPLSQLSKAPPSTAGSSNEPDPGNAALAAGPHTAAVSATSAAGCAVSPEAIRWAISKGKFTHKRTTGRGKTRRHATATRRGRHVCPPNLWAKRPQVRRYSSSSPSLHDETRPKRCIAEELTTQSGVGILLR